MKRIFANPGTKKENTWIFLIWIVIQFRGPATQNPLVPNLITCVGNFFYSEFCVKHPLYPNLISVTDKSCKDKPICLDIEPVIFFPPFCFPWLANYIANYSIKKKSWSCHTCSEWWGRKNKNKKQQGSLITRREFMLLYH